MHTALSHTSQYLSEIKGNLAKLLTDFEYQLYLKTYQIVSSPARAHQGVVRLSDDVYTLKSFEDPDPNYFTIGTHGGRVSDPNTDHQCVFISRENMLGNKDYAWCPRSRFHDKDSPLLLGMFNIPIKMTPEETIVYVAIERLPIQHDGLMSYSFWFVTNLGNICEGKVNKGYGQAVRLTAGESKIIRPAIVTEKSPYVMPELFLKVHYAFRRMNSQLLKQCIAEWCELERRVMQEQRNSDLTAVNILNEKLENEVNVLQTDNLQLQTDLEKAEATVCEYESKIKNLEAENRQLRNRLDKLARINDIELINQIDELVPATLKYCQ